MDEKKLERVLKLLETANEDFASTEDVTKIFDAIIEAFNEVKADVKGQLESTNAAHTTTIDDIGAQLVALERTLRTSVTETVNSHKEAVARDLQAVRDAIPVIPEPPAIPDLTPLQNQIDVLMQHEDPKVEGPEVRDLLESLSGEDRLDASAIKNLPAAIKENYSLVGHPTALHNLMDVDVSGILSGQSLQWNGSSWRPYTPGSGSGLNYLAATGTVDDSNKVFTFVSTPTLVAVNGALYMNGAGVTIVGTTATLDNAPGTGGNVYGLG